MHQLWIIPLGILIGGLAGHGLVQITKASTTAGILVFLVAFGVSVVVLTESDRG